MFEKIEFVSGTEEQITKFLTGTVSFTDILFEFDGWQTEDQEFSQNEESFDEDNEDYFGEEDEEDDLFEEDEQGTGEQETLRNVPLNDHLYQKETVNDSLNCGGQLDDNHDEYVIISYSQPPRECDTVSTTSSTNSDFNGCRSFYYSSESSSVATSVSDLSHDHKHAAVKIRRSCLVNKASKTIKTFCKKTVRFNTMTNIIGCSEYAADDQDVCKTLHEIFMERRLSRKLARGNEQEQDEDGDDPEQERLDLLTKSITNRNVTITKLNNTLEKLII